MNILKATIAIAAVTVCCLGNDYPAKALTEEQRYRLGRAIYDASQQYRLDSQRRYERWQDRQRTCHTTVFGSSATTRCY